MIDELGNNFLSNEAGQIMQEQIDFNQGNAQLQLEQAAEATLNNTMMLNQVSWRLFEEEGTRKSEIFRLEQVRVSDQEALARWQQQVKTDYEQTSSTVLKVQESLSTLEESTAKDISQVKAEIKQVDNKLGPMDARITDQSEAIAKIDETQTKHIETAESRFNDNEALINQLSRTIANAESSLAEMGMQLTAEYGNQAVEQLRIKSSITRLDTVTANKFQSFAQSIEKLETQFNDVNATITTLKKTVSDNEKSQAEVNELIKSEVGENKSAIELRGQTVFDHKGNGSAIYTIKAGINWNGQYYDAKFMMGTTVKNGKVETQIGFSADTFAIFNNINGKMETPFVVKNSQVFLGPTFIEDGSITNAKIGNVIQSNDYRAGESGWHINKNGFAEFQNIKARGEINATSGTFSNATITESCDVKGTVYAEKIEGPVATMSPEFSVFVSRTNSTPIPLFKMIRLPKPCSVWVVGTAGSNYNLRDISGEKVPLAFVNNSLGLIYTPHNNSWDMRLKILVDGKEVSRLDTFDYSDEVDARGVRIANQFSFTLPAGEGVSTVSVVIPHERYTTYAGFVGRAFVMPQYDEITA
ncbi:DUF1983 domain-containing protein [Providencia rettgeri]|nr:DUF1983 domain-containing protein [Providencia rettgeri]